MSRTVLSVTATESATPNLRVEFDTGESLFVAFGNWNDADLYGVRAEAENHWTAEAFAAEKAFQQANAARIAADQPTTVL